MARASLESKLILTAVDGVTKVIDNIHGKLNRLSDPVEKFNVALGAMNARLAKSTKNIEKFASKTKDLGSELTAKVTLPITAGLTASVVQFARIEKAMVDVQNNIGANAEEMDKLSESFTSFSKATDISKMELLGIAEAASDSGVATKDLAGVTEQYAKFQKATNIQGNEYLDNILNILKRTNESNTQFGRLTSTVSGLSSALGVSEEKILEASDALSTQQGLTTKSATQLMSLAGIVAFTGKKFKSANSAFAELGKNMTESVRTGGLELNNFALAAGLTGEQFKKEFAENSVDAMLKVVAGAKKLVGPGRDLKFIFEHGFGITDSGALEALVGIADRTDILTKATQGAAGGWDKYQAGVASADEVQKKFARTQETLQARMKRLLNGVLALAESIGKIMVPFIEMALPVLKFFVDAIGALPAPIKFVAVGAGLLLAALGPLLFVAGDLALKFLALQKIFAGGALLNGLLSLTAPQILTNLALLTEGVFTFAGSVIAATAPLIATLAAFTALWIAGEKIIALFDMLSDKLSFFQKAGTILKALGNVVGIGGEITPSDLGIPIAESRRGAGQSEARSIPLQQVQSSTENKSTQVNELVVRFPNSPGTKGLRTEMNGPANPWISVLQGFQTVGQ